MTRWMHHTLTLSLTAIATLATLAGCGEEPAKRPPILILDDSEDTEDMAPAVDMAPEVDMTPDMSSDTPHLKNMQRGEPQLGSIDALGFGPGGVLLVGDGARNRVVAFDTGDVADDEATRAANHFDEVADMPRKVAAAFGGGVTGGDLTIRDIALNPRSHRVYVAAWRRSTNDHVLLYVDARGELVRVPLETMGHVALSYPDEGMPGSRVRDLAWIDGRVVAATQESDWTPSRVLTLTTPLRHEDTSALTRTRSYHRAHGMWETEAPIDVFMPYMHEGRAYIAASYTCAPVVRFAVDALAAGDAETVGATPFDLGPGKQTLAIAEIGDGPSRAVLITYWYGDPSKIHGLRIARETLTQASTLDDDAQLFFPTQPPENPPQNVEVLPALDGVFKMERRDATHIVALTPNTLKTIAIP